MEGVRSNRSGYGSVVELFRKDGTSVQRWVRGDGSYLAANDPRVHFGLGKSPEIDRIPPGRKATLEASHPVPDYVAAARTVLEMGFRAR